MNRAHKTFLLAVLAATFLHGAVEAQTFGRVALTIELPDGSPAAGAVVRVTCDDITTFDRTLTANKKGKATLAVVDATKTYNVAIDYEGFPTKTLTVKPDIQGTKQMSVTLDQGQQAAPAAAAPAQASFTPAERVFNEGVEAFKAEDYETAKAKFLKSIEMNPNMPFAHLALASYYFQIEDYEAALASAGKAVELDPQSVRAHRIIYETHTVLGNTDEASKAAEVLAEIDKSSDSVAIVFNEGVAAYQVGDTAAAKTAFLRALEMDPQLTAALSALAILYLQEGSWAEAAEMTERHLAVEPGNQKALRMRWDAYRGMGNAEKEKEALAALAESDPEALVINFYNEGAKLFDGNDIAGARASFEKALEVDPNHGPSHYRLGICLVSLGDSAGAREHLEKFIELAPDHPEAESARQMISYLK